MTELGLLESENLSATDILLWARRTFGYKVVASSSFQTQSMPLLHLISQVWPELPVVFVDTGFHFPETLAFRDQVQQRLGLNLIVVHPMTSKHELFAKYGEALYRRDPDLCCYINKVEPMERELSGMAAWITGVRADQNRHRRGLKVVEPQRSGLLKVHPMLSWTKSAILDYIKAHDLPAHPLYAKGYQSVGCAPCTMPVSLGEDERAGRWAGKEKTECGLHLNL